MCIRDRLRTRSRICDIVNDDLIHLFHLDSGSGIRIHFKKILSDPVRGHKCAQSISRRAVLLSTYRLSAPKTAPVRRAKNAEKIPHRIPAFRRCLLSLLCLRILERLRISKSSYLSLSCFIRNGSPRPPFYSYISVKREDLKCQHSYY